MVTLLFGDTQLISDRPVTIQDWRGDSNDKVGDLCRTIMWISSQIEEYDPDTVIFTGDLNEELGDRVSMFSISFIRKVLDILVDDKRAYYFIMGNHDIQDPEGLCSIYSLLPPGKDIHLVLPGMPMEVDDLDMTLISYSPDMSCLQDNLHSVNTSTVVAHIPVQGMEIYNKLKDNGVRLGHPSRFSRIILGHYHIPVNTFMEGVEVISVGSPLYINWNDTDYDSGRGVRIVDDQGEILNISNPTTKRFIKIKYPEGVDDLTRAVQTYKESNINLKILKNKGDKYVTGFKFNSLMIKDISEHKSAEPSESKINSESSYESDISNYVSTCDTNLNKSKLSKLGVDIVKEVVSESQAVKNK